MKYLVNPIKKFTSLVGGIFVLLLLVLISLGFVFNYSTLRVYKFMLLILIALITIMLLYYFITVIAILHIYKHKKSSKVFLFMAKTGFGMLFPLVFFITKIWGNNKDSIRAFYIELNNILVDLERTRFESHRILVLLPHCLQNAACMYKITNDINNCKKCGRCSIGKIIEIAHEKGVAVHVVTGGTAARNIVSKLNPSIILAVACERDLTSGIEDVGKIPVIGIINDRPNGPCYNTNIDIAKFKKRLDEIIALPE